MVCRLTITSLELCKFFQQPLEMVFPPHFTDENMVALPRISVPSPRSLSNPEPRAWTQPLSETKSSLWPFLSRPSASAETYLRPTTKGSRAESNKHLRPLHMTRAMSFLPSPAKKPNITNIRREFSGTSKSGSLKCVVTVKSLNPLEVCGYHPPLIKYQQI